MTIQDIQAEVIRLMDAVRVHREQDMDNTKLFEVEMHLRKLDMLLEGLRGGW